MMEGIGLPKYTSRRKMMCRTGKRDGEREKGAYIHKQKMAGVSVLNALPPPLSSPTHVFAQG